MRTNSGRRSVSRRAFVRGLAAGGVLVAAPDLWVQPAVAGTADLEQLHLQFGSDASREVVVLAPPQDTDGKTSGAFRRRVRRRHAVHSVPAVTGPIRSSDAASARVSASQAYDAGARGCSS